MSAPKFNDLYVSVISDLKNRFNLQNVIGKIAINALSFVQAGKLKLVYLRNEFIYKNIFPDKADSEDQEGTLGRFGGVKLGRSRNPAQAGIYLVEVTGEIGAVIAPNTTFKSLDTATSAGKLFVLDSVFTFITTSGQITLRALDLGKEAELIAQDQLQVTQPISNVDSFATVLQVTDAPLEAESIEEYRKKVIQAFRTESQGGAKSDYKFEWSLDAQGVLATYPYLANSPLIINLFIEATVADSTDGKGTPSQAIIDDVRDVIEFDPDITKSLGERGRRPMGAWQINFLPITPINVDVEITNLTDNSLIISIEEAITDFLTNVRPFIDGADDPNDSQKGLLYESDIYGVVKDVIGIKATFESLKVKVSGNYITIYKFTDGNIPSLNTVINV